MSTPIQLFTLLICAWIVGVLPMAVRAQETAKGIGPSVLDGVYTSAQARRGQAQFEEHCASCHRRDLGGIAGPALKGDRFLDQWREFPLEVLVNDMGAQMPLRNPGVLPASTYVDITAYLLEANGLPTGQHELTKEVAARVLFVAPGGPKPLPTSSPAMIAGCMTKEAGAGWFLTSASEPARTLNPYEFTDSERKSAGQIAPGGGLFRLQNLDALPGSTEAADRLVGQKVVAKGILVRAEKGNRLNVAALNALGGACEP
jgi:S-disulfanyl-L-cysteine oxidoreductase SoxD